VFFEAPEPSPTLKRSRGRPRGSKAVVMRPGTDGRALGVHHVAFLRSTLLGLDLRAAFERYLAFGETTTDLRHVEARRKELMAQIVDAGRRLMLARPDDTALARDVDLLKIAHHGSKGSSTSRFLALASPEYAVISVGAGNSYGHPAQETLTKLAALGVDVYRTDVGGTITVRSDGSTFTFDRAPDGL